MKSQKGITLIALVITIIVMLILVGVSISMAVNGGLFDYASDATRRTNQAISAENDLGDGIVKVDGAGVGGVNTLVDYYVNGTTTASVTGQ